MTSRSERSMSVVVTACGTVTVDVRSGEAPSVHAAIAEVRRGHPSHGAIGRPSAEMADAARSAACATAHAWRSAIGFDGSDDGPEVLFKRRVPYAKTVVRAALARFAASGMSIDVRLQYVGDAECRVQPASPKEHA
jgi:hypothetical protein